MVIGIPTAHSQVGYLEIQEWYLGKSLHDLIDLHTGGFIQGGRIPNLSWDTGVKLLFREKASKILTWQQAVLATNFQAWKSGSTRNLHGWCHGTVLWGVIASAQMLRVSATGGAGAQTLLSGHCGAGALHMAWMRPSLMEWLNIPDLLTESLGVKLSWVRCVCCIWDVSGCVHVCVCEVCL